MTPMLSYKELAEQITVADKGIEPVLTNTVGGELITLHRQGHPTAWHIFLARNGTGRISKSKTASIPAVLLEFDQQHQSNIKIAIVDYINNGWI